MAASLFSHKGHHVRHSAHVCLPRCVLARCRSPQGVQAASLRAAKSRADHILLSRPNQHSCACLPVSQASVPCLLCGITLLPRPAAYPAVLAAALRRTGLNGSAADQAVAALQALPAALGSVASLVQGGIDVLNDTVQQASPPGQPDRGGALVVGGLVGWGWGGGFGMGVGGSRAGDACVPPRQGLQHWLSSQLSLKYCHPSCPRNTFPPRPAGTLRNPADRGRDSCRLGGHNHVHPGHLALQPDCRPAPWLHLITRA